MNGKEAEKYASADIAEPAIETEFSGIKQKTDAGNISQALKQLEYTKKVLEVNETILGVDRHAALLTKLQELEKEIADLDTQLKNIEIPLDITEKPDEWLRLAERSFQHWNNEAIVLSRETSLTQAQVEEVKEKYGQLVNLIEQNLFEVGMFSDTGEKIGKLKAILETAAQRQFKLLDSKVTKPPQAPEQNQQNRLENLQEIEDLKNLTESLLSQLQATDADPQAFDPRARDAAGNIPLIELQHAITQAQEIIPDKGQDVGVNTQIKQVNETIVQPAKKALDALFARIRKIDTDTFVTWQNTAKITDVYTRATTEPVVAPGTTPEEKAQAAEQKRVYWEQVVADLDEEMQKLVDSLDPDILKSLNAALPNKEVDTLKAHQKQFWEALKAAAQDKLSKLEPEKQKNVALIELRRMLVAAEATSSISIDTTRDNVSTNFSPIYRKIEELKRGGISKELREFEIQTYKAEFKQRQKAFTASIATVENIEANAQAVASRKEHIHEQRIFEPMASIIANLKTLNVLPVEIKAMEHTLHALEKDNKRRSFAAWVWSKYKDEGLYGKTMGTELVRTIDATYSSADYPLSGQDVLDILDETELKGTEGANVVLKTDRKRIIRADLLPGIRQTVAGSEVKSRAVGNGLVEVEYTETAAEWLMEVLDDIYEKNHYYADGSIIPLTEQSPVDRHIKVDGVLYKIPVVDNVKKTPISAHNLHSTYNQVMDFVFQIENSRTSNKPRFDKTLVQRIFRLHLMTTWNHQALARGSMIGLGDLAYYSFNWPAYARTEFFEGVATYNVLPTAFIFGYEGFSPWSLLGKDGKAIRAVEKALREVRVHGHSVYEEYEFLLHSFITLADTSTTEGKPNYTVFNPPLRSVKLGETPEGEPLRRDVAGEEGLILTPDDIRDVNGKRIYSLMPLDRLNLIADVLNNYGKNAIKMLNSILKTDVSKWDDNANVINDMKKQGKYTVGLFPKVGLEVVHEGESGMFINRFAMYLVLMKAIVMLMPKQVRGGGDKKLQEVSTYLNQEQTKKTISLEQKEVLMKILTELYQFDVFKRELTQDIAHQFKELYKVSG